MKKVLSYMSPHISITCFSLAIKVIGSFSELALPYILSYIIDDLIPYKDISRIYIYGLIMLFFALLALCGNIFANILSAKATGRMTHDLRKDLFHKTSHLRCSDIDRLTMPSIISRLTSDTYYVNQMVVRTMRMGVRTPILLIGGLLFTFILDVKLALILTCSLPFVLIAIYFITIKGAPLYTKVQLSGDDMVRSVQETVTGIRVIKALSKENYESHKFENVAENVSKSDYIANRLMLLSNPLITLILNATLVCAIIIGASLSTNPGVMTAYLSYVTIILNAVIGMSKVFVDITRGIASSKRIEEVLSIDTTERVIADEFSKNDSMIEFDNVSFSYNGLENNLSNITFSLKKGETLGIIGATGSGKSTLINLMLKFYEANEGKVYIDRKNVLSYTSSDLHKKFGVAFQNDFLMSASIRDNIDYGRGLTFDEIKKGASCAMASEFIDKLESKYDHVLSQKATNISGGQKQRLLVARALASSPQIIVLDDSSSALDYATDASMRSKINANFPFSTKVIIAQRVSSIKHANVILVLDDGKIIGKGTHDELMVNCDEYNHIATSQMGEM